MVTDREWTALGPFDKWRLFALPPWKFFLHVVLLLLVTTQVIVRATTYDEVRSPCAPPPPARLSSHVFSERFTVEHERTADLEPLVSSRCVQ